jgi:hypothetical protein
MASWVESIMSPLKAAGDMAQGLIEIRDTVKFGDAIIKLQAQIMSAYQGAATAQAREAATIEEISSLKRRVAELETWDAEKKRYQLDSLPPGVFVYTLKPAMAESEPMHHICQTCYQRGKKSILQADEHHNGVHHLSCNECGTQLLTGNFRAPRLEYDQRYED